MTKKRHAAHAAILSLLLPGLGHIYLGNIKKGVCLIGAKYSAILTMGAMGLLSTFYGIITLVAGVVIIYAFALYDAVKTAPKKKDYQVKVYNRWYVYLGLLLIISLPAKYLFSSKADTLGYEIFSIPGDSMSPLLQRGDIITVNTWADNIKVGDVVAFVSPKDKQIKYTKRVAALGGDNIAIKQGEVIRNGKREPLLQVQSDKRTRNYSLSMKERQIPENTVFLLGDWRDRSNDSRFFGPVSVDDIIGQVIYIFYSQDADRIGTPIHT